MTANVSHQGAEIYRAGAELRKSTGVVVLLHGRGGSAADILNLGREMAPSTFTLIAPQANGHTWYPYSFLAPRAQNEPCLTSALALVESIVVQSITEGVASERIVLCGFSQGACLATEFVATYARRYGALVAFTGGLIGPPDSNLAHSGSLAGTPVLFSSGDPDPHVPWVRVEESAVVLRGMGAVVETRRYPGRPHTVLPEEVRMARELIKKAFS